MRKWQPIKTAPKDGTEVELRFYDGSTARGSWKDETPEEETERWFAQTAANYLSGDPHYRAKSAGPTHWRPLSSSPASA